MMTPYGVVLAGFARGDVVTFQQKSGDPTLQSIDVTKFVEAAMRASLTGSATWSSGGSC
jgi:hypothetical protein